jgi:PTS system mannose-specific IIA component
MIGLVIATHGTFGEALLGTVTMIIGPPVRACAVSLSREQAPDELRALLIETIRRLDPEDDGVLVAADMFGGTPANIGMTLLAPGRVELVTGVNLPMLLKFFSCRERYPLAELAGRLRDHARDSIVLGSEALACHPRE